MVIGVVIGLFFVIKVNYQAAITLSKDNLRAAILIMKSSGRRNRYFKTFEHKFEHLSPIVKANISS